MFITAGTVFSQLFWFAVCFLVILYGVKQIFIKRIKGIMLLRKQKMASLKHYVDSHTRNGKKINEKSRELEKEMYEYVREQKQALEAQMQAQHKKELEQIKEGYKLEKAKLQKDIQNWKKTILKEVNADFPTIAADLVKQMTGSKK